MVSETLMYIITNQLNNIYSVWNLTLHSLTRQPCSPGQQVGKKTPHPKQASGTRVFFFLGWTWGTRVLNK